MDQTSPLFLKDCLIAVYDIENFAPIMAKLGATDLFALMNDLQIVVIDSLAAHHPLIVKNVGDANLMIFEAAGIDEKLLALLNLKKKLEARLKASGFANRTRFSAHVGEIAVGMLGKEPFQGLDAFGEAVNIAFIMNGKPFRGRFNITPQLFRRLESGTRKSFHKFTPTVTYLAEEMTAEHDGASIPDGKRKVSHDS